MIRGCLPFAWEICLASQDKGFELGWYRATSLVISQAFWDQNRVDDGEGADSVLSSSSCCLRRSQAA